jgi:antitoxin component of MazEF toxin-antitoxin module
MNKPLKPIKIGNSTGVVLPKEVLAHLNAAQGDEVSFKTRSLALWTWRPMAILVLLN